MPPFSIRSRIVTCRFSGRAPSAHAVQLSLPVALALSLLLAPKPATAQATTNPPASSLSAADSTLVGRILLAEDARDAADEALAAGRAHADPRIRALAVRAHERITDPLFSKRDSLSALPALPAPPVYPEPAWRLRYRALAANRTDCGAINAALSDSAWAVRLHAADVVDTSCTRDAAVVGTLVGWLTGLPTDASRRAAGGVSWHAAAHAVLALARLRPAPVSAQLPPLLVHAQPEMRAYAVRAATQIGDTAALARAVGDLNANVRSLAIDGLRRNGGHIHDARYLDALRDSMAQVVRSAAIALAGSPRADAKARTLATFETWVQRGSATERDVRHALLTAAGRDTSEDRPHAPSVDLPPHAIALALGADIRVRVQMAPASGGGAFVVRMRGDVAPMMAAQILSLVEREYYDGMAWHRVEHDFVVQGGSPDANEYVGLTYFLRDALGTVPHARGTVGMSTRGHDTGDGQWFFNLRDNLRLGRDYTVFAEVIEGIDVVDGILEGDVIGSMRVIGDG